MTVLMSDKPLVNPKDDQLGYASIAAHLAGSLSKMSAADGLVIGICGAWGTGKSTLSNFIAYYLRESSNNGENPILVYFNPWWFSGQQGLTSSFFKLFQTALKSDKARQTFHDLTVLIDGLATLVSIAPVPGSDIPKKFTALFPNLDIDDVIKIKKSIEEKLRESNIRILVIIDDIDRLTTDEIRELFRVVKSIADFPNVTYLMTFDRNVVARSLDNIQGVTGEKYLEKIVQLFIDLPVPDKSQLLNMLTQRINVLVSGTPDNLQDSRYWNNVLNDGLQYMINTPRDVTRLLNALSVTYPPVMGEVNAVDFVAIEALRLFYPDVHSVIRSNGHMFVASSRSPLVAATDLKNFHDFWLTQIPQESQPFIRALVKRLFPRLESIWGSFSVGVNANYEADWLPKWRKDCRICSAENFSNYFLLVPSQVLLSNTEIRAAIQAASDVEILEAILSRFAAEKSASGVSKARMFLGRFHDYLDDLPISYFSNFIQALFRLADSLDFSEGRDSFLPFDDNLSRIGFIVDSILSRIKSPTERFELLRNVMSTEDSLSLSVHIVMILGQDHGKYGAERITNPEQCLIDDKELKDLELLVVEKIREHADSGTLIELSELRMIVAMWRDNGSMDEIREWLNHTVLNDDFLTAQLLERFMGRIISQSMGDTMPEIRYKFDLKWIENYVDAAFLATRVEAILDKSKSDLSRTQRIALQLFLEAQRQQQATTAADDIYDER